MNENKLTQTELNIIESEVISVLKTCYDPEIPVNIYELGLIYGINVSDDGEVEIKMTLTTPYCPSIQSLPAEVESRIGAIKGVTSTRIILVWDPPWSPSRMSESARLELGFL